MFCRIEKDESGTYELFDFSFPDGDVITAPPGFPYPFAKLQNCETLINFYENFQDGLRLLLAVPQYWSTPGEYLLSLYPLGVQLLKLISFFEHRFESDRRFNFKDRAAFEAAVNARRS